MWCITRLFKNELTREFWKVEIIYHTTQIITKGTIGQSEGNEDRAVTVFDSQEELTLNTEKLIKLQVKNGFIEEVDWAQEEKIKRIENIDLTGDGFWSTVEQEFYSNAKKAILNLISKDFKSSHITFWVHVEYPPFFIYSESGSEVAKFDVPILWDAYEKYEESRVDMPISHDDLAKKLFDHCGKSIEKMAVEKCFDEIVDNALSIEFQTVDEQFGEVVEIKGNEQ